MQCLRRAVVPVFQAAAQRWATMAASEASGALVVHFDVNKTLLCTDKAGGKSLVDVLNSIVSDYSFGVSEPSTGKWTLKLQPGQEGDKSGMISFSNFVEDSLPYATIPKGASVAEAQAIRDSNRETRLKRTDTKVRFTHDGEPGAACFGMVSQWQEALRIPEDLLPACQALPYLQEGYYHLIPAYFVALEALATGERQAAIVFRTFGSDLPQIVQEHNLYCEAKHPAFPGVQPLDGSTPGRPDMRLATSATGAILRHSGPHGDLMALAITTAQAGFPPVVDTVTGPAAVAHCINAHLGVEADVGLEGAAVPEGAPPLVHPVLALRDDYLFWHHAGEVGEAGKLLLVDPADPSVHPVFFDDNIGEEEACIVDARHAATGEALPFSLTKDVFLVRCNIGEAVLDRQYFLKKIARSEELRAERVGKGGAGQ